MCMMHCSLMVLDWLVDHSFPKEDKIMYCYKLLTAWYTSYSWMLHNHLVKMLCCSLFKVFTYYICYIPKISYYKSEGIYLWLGCCMVCVLRWYTIYMLYTCDTIMCFRFYGRKMLYMLMTHQDFDKMLAKHLNSSTLRNVKEIVETLKVKVS